MIVTGTVHVPVLKCFLFFCFFFYIRSYISNIIYMYFLYLVLSKSASHQLTNKIENIQLTRKLLKGRDGHDGVTGRNGLPGPPGAPG